MSDKYLCETCENKLSIFKRAERVECCSGGYTRERQLKKKNCRDCKIKKNPPNCDDEEFTDQADAVLKLLDSEDDHETKKATLSYYLFRKARHYYNRGKNE